MTPIAKQMCEIQKALTKIYDNLDMIHTGLTEEEREQLFKDLWKAEVEINNAYSVIYARSQILDALTDK